MNLKRYLRNEKSKTRVSMVIGVLLVLFFIMLLLTNTNAKNSGKKRVIVALGDSYSSGEGIEKFFGQDKDISQKVQDPDWLAHRSKEAWSGRLVLRDAGGRMSDNKDNWYFVAASGAETFNVNGKHCEMDPQYKDNKPEEQQGKQKKAYNKQSGKYKDEVFLPLQLDVFDEIDGDVAYVTMTMGGNDAGFASVVTNAVIPLPEVKMPIIDTYLIPNFVADNLENSWGRFYETNGIRDRLYELYVDIEKKAGKDAAIIIAGYPLLFDEDGAGVATVMGGSTGLVDPAVYKKSAPYILPESIVDQIKIFSEEDATLINDNVSRFNDCIEAIVSLCRSNGMNIWFVSVEDVFKGHAAYTSETPYINPVLLIQKEDIYEDVLKDPTKLISAYSMHPNLLGSMAYASCVQEKIDELEGISDVGKINDHIKLIVYDYKDEIHGGYKIRVTGSKYKGILKSGIWKEEYDEEFEVNEPKEMRLIIPEGEYEICVTDNESGLKCYKKNVKVRHNAKKDCIEFRTCFGEADHFFEGEDTDDETVTLDIPEDAVEFEGHRYYLFDGGIVSTYQEAEAYCKSKGGYLATITSKEENEKVYQYIRSKGCDSAFFGLHDLEIEGEWKWNTGEKFSYSNWADGEPNGLNNENYGMFYYQYPDGKWNDGDFYDNPSFICEWGDYVIDDNAEELSKKRKIVLTLDVSGSMEGSPLDETKIASLKFIEEALNEDAGIGIVSYESYSSINSPFSDDRNDLEGIINSLGCGGGTNTGAGLKDASWMLEKTEAEKKFIVLMSDGEANEGEVGDDLVKLANEIKEKGIKIFTLGFFSSVSDRASVQRIMGEIASDGCHYEVENAEDLKYFFEDMADQINGQKYIYIRIACPVDVRVSYAGETLDSDSDNPKTRTSFGTLTFEDSDEEDIDEGSDNRVKVLRLKDSDSYDIQIVGTGRGMMNYTIGFMDENGDYSDMRKFRNVKITRDTEIDTVAAHTDNSELNIDEDGDGKYDLKLRADANGYGKEVSMVNWIVYVIIGAIVFILLDIIAIIVYKKRKVSE